MSVDLMAQVAQAEAAADALELKTEQEQEQRFLSRQKELQAAAEQALKAEMIGCNSRLAEIEEEGRLLYQTALEEADEQLAVLRERTAHRRDDLVDVVKEILLR
ncbi:MAG: hypothetical protein SPL15_00275 [Lachnospiraceae bacterium]|nr:hypothetical protein [Lachnospiraceae bacterium]MDY5741424.1 hypothetical protein [Lachnospiraceae bacterium]